MAKRRPQPALRPLYPCGRRFDETWVAGEISGQARLKTRDSVFDYKTLEYIGIDYMFSYLVINSCLIGHIYICHVKSITKRDLMDM